MTSVLVVDDDQATRSLIRALLLRDGIEVITAGDGRQALEILSRRRIDAVVLDLQMPVMSGVELLERLEETEPDRRNIVVVTAANPDSFADLRKKRVVTILRKPFDVAELREVVLAATCRELLVVEDDASHQYLIDRALRAAGYHVTIANTGERALRLMRESSYDAVVVDLGLPGIDGYDFITAARADGVPPLPIVVLTISETLARDPGADVVLSKRNGFEKLVPAIRGLLP